MSDNDNDIYHVLPVNDMFDHDDDLDLCVCGPEIMLIEREDDSTAFEIVHNSFDRRELYE